MAGEWIKIEVGTPDKPEVIRIARLLQIDRDLVMGKLCRLWSWFDRNSVDGTVDGVVSTDVDDVVGLAGFMCAVQVVGWCGFDDQAERVWLTNFDAHNGETAKQRAQKNKRQAKWRKGSGDSEDEKQALKSVDAAPSTSASTREEKRREEVNNTAIAVLAVTKKFIKPSLIDLITEFTDRVSDPANEAAKFLNHYESNGWKVGRNPMKSWPHSVTNWVSNCKPMPAQAQKSITDRMTDTSWANETITDQNYIDHERAQA